jgi:hypothetical protein
VRVRWQLEQIADQGRGALTGRTLAEQGKAGSGGRCPLPFVCMGGI